MKLTEWAAAILVVAALVVVVYVVHIVGGTITQAVLSNGIH